MLWVYLLSWEDDRTGAFAAAGTGSAADEGGEEGRGGGGLD